MFTSISRGRAKFVPNYICPSCLTNILPHPGPQPARQPLNRESFSTTSNKSRADDDDASPTTDTSPTIARVKSTESRSMRSRREKRLTPISRSQETLSALREFLQHEEKVSKEPVTKPPAKKTKSKPAGVKVSKNALSSLKAELSAEATGSEKPTSKPPKKKNVTEAAESAEDGTASPSLGDKPAKRKTSAVGAMTETTTEATKKAPESSSDMADPGAGAGFEIRRMTRKPRVKLPTKAPTDAQRRKVEALLLGVKSKKAAALGKKINSHIHMIGENKTREALIKIIEDGKLSKTDAVKVVRKLTSKSPAKRRIAKRVVVTATTVRSRPLIRTVSTEDLSTTHVSLPRVKSRNRRYELSPPDSFIRADIRSDLSNIAAHYVESKRVKNLKDAMMDQPARSRLTRPTTRPSRSKAGENIRTGPLKEGEGFEIKTLDASDLELTPISKPQPEVPSLWYGLERVLFNPGVYQLQDPRSRVYNFDPYLQTIMPVGEFDFTALKKYITSSRDETLLATAREEKKKYTGSTSSTTAALAHFHFLLSQWRPINAEMLSQNFPVEYKSFTALQRGPSAVFLKWKDGVYAIDADKQFDTANILSTLGKSMEKFLTLPTEEFERYRKENSDQIPMEEREATEAFNYTTIGDFLLRSQLDAYDPRLPGTGMFDLKTRAVVSIRMDTSKYEQGMDYEIRKRFGEWESYEREYYDMIRAAFLKYSLQVRMGRMDGIFVAFHNTQRIFGFQYISLPEMDLALHGTEDTTTGDLEFKLSLELLNKVLDRAAAKYPEKSLRLHFETRGTDVPFMYIFAEPMEDEEIVEIQESNKAIVDEFEKRVLGLGGEEEKELMEEEKEEEKKAAEWASMRARVEENMEKDELDIEEARAVAETLINESLVYDTDAMSAEEKERMISELLESAAFSADEDEDTVNLSADREAGEDGVEGASADSEDDDLEDDEGEVREDEEDDNEDEENEEEDEGENEEDEEVEEELQEESEDIEESDNLETTEISELTDKSPTEDIAEEAGTEASELLADPESTEPVDEFQDEPNEDANEFIDEIRDEAANDTADIEIVNSDEPELVENKAIAPDDAQFESDAQESNNAEESTSDPDDISAFDPDDVEGEMAEETWGLKGKREVLAMTLTIRNKVNDEYVDRPRNLTSKDKWTIEYAIEEIPSPQRTRKLYNACKVRRANALSNAKRDANSKFNQAYMGNLRDLSKKGKAWRERRNQKDSKEPLKVLDWNRVKEEADHKVWDKKE